MYLIKIANYDFHIVKNKYLNKQCEVTDVCHIIMWQLKIAELN